MSVDIISLVNVYLSDKDTLLRLENFVSIFFKFSLIIRKRFHEYFYIISAPTSLFTPCSM